MFDTQAIQDSFGKAATEYDANALLQRKVREHCISLAKNLWKEKARVLDAGCGTGALARQTGWQITGLDLSAGMCREAAKKMPAINADATRLPFAANSFDGVFSSLMLQWLAAPRAVFSEIERVLVPGGHAVIATLADGTLFELKTAFASLDHAPHASDFSTPHHILTCAEEAGLTLVSARQATLIEHYPDTVALMRSLKAIGAGNKHASRKRGLMTSRQFARLEAAYCQFEQAEGLPATWQVLTLVLRK